MKQAKEFLEGLLKGLVNYPDDVEVEVSKDEMGILMRVWVHKEDMGIVIGRKGVNAGAIKLVTKLYGFSHKLRISVKIEEPKDHE